MLECSISILTKNEERNIGACLDAIFAQKAVEQFEVIVIDSGSTDATLQIARGYPIRIEQIPAHEFHHARTRNFAASLSKGPILVNLSQDATPASDMWLHKMIANFQDPSVGAVYGRQLPKPGSTLERFDTFDAVYGEKKIVKDPAHRNGLGYRFYHFSDVNSALRRTVWETIPYPENFKVFDEPGNCETDSGCRMEDRLRAGCAGVSFSSLQFPAAVQTLFRYWIHAERATDLGRARDPFDLIS